MKKFKRLTALMACAVMVVGGAMSFKRITPDIGIKPWNYCNKCGQCHDYADCGRPDPNGPFGTLSHDIWIY